MAIDDLARWLKTTAVASLMNNSWAWPACEILHFIGLSLLIGIVGILDLRMLGIVRRLPPAPLNRLLPWAIAGFVLNLVTGVLFFVAEPFQYLHNAAFQLKMLFIVLAGINVVFFYATGVSRRVDTLEALDTAPPRAKVAAAISLMLWIGVIVFGRMIPWSANGF